MTNNNGKNKRSKKPSKQFKKTTAELKKIVTPKKGKIKTLPQLLEVITDYLKGIKKKKAQ